MHDFFQCVGAVLLGNFKFKFQNTLRNLSIKALGIINEKGYEMWNMHLQNIKLRIWSGGTKILTHWVSPLQCVLIF